ncbi:isoprenylcysteine carboxylmethyltransferase family protein [Mycobacterium sp. NAZ190054]|uniref:methyltransferase family protein n=1 Tax=Mycobacterium sp. NAZ190054 TaxID=1747766 RepID=UPI00079B4A12|nr:isoprenylcysteine carboxylmethyltransferase family protein [Mycobacterium sp. NAZ190054]KWX67815.1 hypothetical protein ASJ79_20365 [Mycobacterium sp. NAZ190054]
MKALVQTLWTVPIGLTVFGLMVFGPAGSFDYWQGWTFIAVFALATLIPSVYLGRASPEALRRRTHAGPRAETRTLQKAVSVLAFGSLAAMIMVSALDFRFGWSAVPAGVSVAGDILVALGLGIAMLAVIQNAYAAANVTVESGQQLATAGMYAVVRHPMYSENVIMMIGIPLALASYWGLLFVIPGLIVLALRISDEENMLTTELAGYRDYKQQVRHRLVPGLW